MKNIKQDNREIKINHKECVEIAKKWACGRCGVVLAERYDGGRELPDIVAWSYRFSLLIECKVSHSDFLADKKKSTRREEWDGKNCIGNLRIYCCPKGVIKEIEIPDDWMLLEIYPSGYAKLNVNPWGYLAKIKNSIWWHELTNEALLKERFMMYRALQDTRETSTDNKIIIKPYPYENKIIDIYRN